MKRSELIELLKKAAPRSQDPEVTVSVASRAYSAQVEHVTAEDGWPPGESGVIDIKGSMP